MQLTVVDGLNERSIGPRRLSNHDRSSSLQIKQNPLRSRRFAQVAPKGQHGALDHRIHDERNEHRYAKVRRRADETLDTPVEECPHNQKVIEEYAVTEVAERIIDLVPRTMPQHVQRNDAQDEPTENFPGYTEP